MSQLEQLANAYVIDLGGCPMISFFRKLWRDKRGNALIIAAAALPLVIGSAGLASDTIQWALWKRQIQRAADSGAIAGVYSIVENSGGRTGVSDAVTRDMSKFLNLIKNSKGATAIEYGLIAALIAVAAIGAMQGIGTKLGTTFNNVSNKL